MATTTLYIGHNHPNGEHSHDDVLACVLENLPENIEGFTAYTATGYYHGQPEQTSVFVFSMLDDKQTEFVRYALCFALREQLAQECIGVMTVADNMEYL